jgi:hypothetical protein
MLFVDQHFKMGKNRRDTMQGKRLVVADIPGKTVAIS